MGHHASVWDTAGAVLLLLWAVGMWAGLGVLALATRGRGRMWPYHATAGMIVLGAVGQVGHIQEHIAQVDYWILHSNAPAWMTPWGGSLARGLGQVAHSRPSLGMEILHLTGNFIFLAGLAGIMVITRRARRTSARKWAKMGVWMQGIHGVEHVVLTLSVALGAKDAIGLSTWFGLLQAGPGLATYRIWWHFIANVMGSVVFAMALYHLWRERHEVESTYRAMARGMAPGQDSHVAHPPATPKVTVAITR